MALETKHNLNQETIEKLQTLIRANIDSFEGFEESASLIADENIKQVFAELAVERTAMAVELQQFVEYNGEESVDSGSFAASVHRAWMNVRSAVSSNDSATVLSEAERGEDHIKEAYEDVLKDTAGSAMNDVLQQQYAKVKAGHDRIRDLRDLHLKS